MEKLNTEGIEDIMALTPMQEGLLFHYLKEPDSDLYWAQLCLEINGQIDPAVFQKAWNTVIKNNPALRTLFRWEGIKNPVQIVLKENPLTLRFFDLTADNENKKDTIEKIKEKDRKEKFQWTQVPFRVTLCKTGQNRWTVLISNHHILYDGWSNGIILKEWVQAYHAWTKGKIPHFSTKTKFKEFVKTVRNRDITKEENYWKNYLNDFPSGTGLTAKKKPDSKHDNKKERRNAGYYRVGFSQDIQTRFHETARIHKLTPASLLYCNWAILLQKYIGHEDVVFGTTVSGRSTKIEKIETLVGLFLNTLPLRVRTSPQEKVIDLLLRVNHTLREREQYENTPLTDIRKYHRSGNKGELFDSIMVVENYPIDKATLNEGNEFSIESFSVVEQNNFPLTVEITSFGDMELRFVYKKGLFAEEDIIGISRDFMGLLEAMLNGLEKEVPALEIIQPVEMSQPEQESASAAPEVPEFGARSNRTAVANVHDHAINSLSTEAIEIEAQLLKYPAVKEALVAVKTSDSGLSLDNRAETYLSAYFVAHDNLPISVSHLKEFLTAGLPGHRIPTYFVQIDGMPLLDNGEIDRQAFLTDEGLGFNVKIKASAVEPATEIEKKVADIWKDVLQVEKIGIHDNFFDAGGNSLNILRVLSELKREFDRPISLATMFRYPSISGMTVYLENEINGEADTVSESKNESETERETEEITGKCIDKGIEKNDRRVGSEIAVIGMAGKFPGAPDIDTFWENLKNGICSISFFTDRELEESGIPADIIKRPGFVKAKGIIDEVEYFDAVFFNYTSREAELMNPQFRILHECTWEALENAGYNSEVYGGRIGFFAGLTDNLYWLSGKLTHETPLSEQFEILNLNSNSFSTLLSYKMNLTGPSLTVQTACSTSLAAIHQACRSLLGGECRLALAGGASILFPVKSGYIYQPGMVKSPDGFCRAFDAQANGTIGGDGVAIVVLKCLEHALADGDHIEAVIKGSAINNDGARKVGYTAPSVEGQTEVITAALDMAQIDPETIGYVETHGTGTVMGDPIEIEALKLAFHSPEKGFCRIGSVKTNIGHLDATAGAAGFIKTVLTLKHKLIPPSLHFISPNPNIDFENSPFRVNTQVVEWKSGPFPRRAGVSSFGIGGTNAHIILEEAPPDLIQTTGERPYKLIMLSAKSETALNNMTENLASHITKNPGLNLDHVAYTLQTGRNTYPHRRMLVCSNRAEALEALSTATAGKTFTHMDKEEKHPVVFIFPGLGGQYVNMGLDLYRTESCFQQEMDRCFQILEPLLGIHLKEILYPGDSSPSSLDLQDFDIAQVALFIFEHALATLLISWGIRPHAMLGYSFGEYTAACVAGVFSLEDALKLVAARGRLIRNAAPGAMLSVPLEASQLTPLLTTYVGLSIAIDNGPSCVVAGLEAEVAAFEGEMKKKRLICTRLPAAHALHTPLLGSIAKELEEIIAGKVALNKPRIPYISNITGDWITLSQAMDAGYWGQHLSRTVRFADGVKKLMAEPGTIFLEIGPGKDISTLLLRYTQDNPNRQIIPLVRNARENVADDTYLVKKIGLLWLYGVPIDWRGYYAFQKPKRAALPTYPFERQQFPLGNLSIQPGVATTASTKLLKKPGISDWFYAPAWKPSVLQIAHPQAAPLPGGCLLFMDEAGFGRPLLEKLEALGGEVFCVNSGKEFSKESKRSYVIDPTNRKHYEQLIDLLKGDGRVPRLILHLWGITGGSNRECNMENVNREQETGLYSLLNLVQAIGGGNFSRKDTFYLMVITDNMQHVPGQETLYPGKAPMLGAIKVIPREYPFIRCSSIDIILPQPGIWQQERLYTQLLAEITTAAAETGKEAVEVIALRGGERLAQNYEAVPLPESNQLPRRLRQKGVYLVTGGLGGIGLEISKFLARDFQARLVLTGRTPFPPRQEWEQCTIEDENRGLKAKIQELRQLEALGSEVLIIQADVADLKQMWAAVEKTKRTFGPIHGVIHCAGELDFGGLIHGRTQAVTQRILAPKISGTLVLDRIFNEEPLDFFILCSSLSTIIVPFGQVGYCAANTFLDSFAHYRTLIRGRFTVAVNWDSWKEVGSAQAAGNRLSRAYKFIDYSISDFALSPAEGIEIFKRALQHNLPQVVVCTRDLNQLAAQGNVYGESVIRETGSESDFTAKTRQPRRTDLGVPYVPPSNDLQQTLVQLWQNFLGIQQVGILDDFFALGIDSLIAITIAAKIHKITDVQVPISAFFSHPTIEGLAQYISDSSGSDVYTGITPAEQKEYYALSSAQQRLYILQQMRPGSAAYNESSVWILEGELDKEKLEQTFNKLVQRHESFRTSIVTAHSEPFQQIHGRIEFEIEFYEAIESPEPFIHAFIRPFDLSRAPLLRVGLIKPPNGGHWLVIDMHHIITDGISYGILARDFLRIYAGEEPATLTIGYKDYAEWQYGRQAGDNSLQRQQAFWLEEFKGELPLLNLPLDFPRPGIQQMEGNTLRFEVGAAETAGLRQLATGQSATLYIVLLSIYIILLSKLGGQEDIIVGTPTAGRRRSELENIIGMFVNTLGLRNYPEGQKTFSAFLQEVRERAWKAFENQDYQYEKLVDSLLLERDTGRNPLFDVEFSLENMEIPVVEIPGLAIKPIVFETGISKFDLILTGVENKDNLDFSFTYSVNLFRKESLECFINYFKTIISGVLANPGQQLQEIELMSEIEKKQFTWEINDTHAEYPGDKTLHGLFEQQAERVPDYIAVSDKDIFTTYKELNDKAGRFSMLLIEEGAEPGGIVGIMGERSIEAVAGILGIIKSGCAYCPIDPDYPQERIEYMLKDSKAKLLVNEKFFRGSRAPRRGVPVKVFQKNPPCSANFAYLIYTSGSTGKPKGVMIKHQSAVNYIHWAIRAYINGQVVHFPLFTSLTFDLTVTSIFAPLLSGNTIFIYGENDTQLPLEMVLQEDKVNAIKLTPSHLRVIQGMKPLGKFRFIKKFIVGGEALDTQLAQEIYRKFAGQVEIYNEYGPTEATVGCMIHRYDPVRDTRPQVPIGLPIANTKFFILAPRHKPVPVGVTGELYIAGAGLAGGYLNNPGLTEERFILPSATRGSFEKPPLDPTKLLFNHYSPLTLYKTGDLARLLPDGTVEFLGRADRQMKIRGYRIEPAEIENHLAKHPEIEEVVVLDREDTQGNKKLCAYIVAKQDLSPRELREFLLKELPEYMVPSYFVQLEKIPLTTHHKIDINAFPSPMEHLLTGDAGSGTPSTQTEQIIAGIWKEVLGREDIGPEANFFDYGGNSLEIIKVNSKLKEFFNRDIPILSMFQYPTIRSLATHLSGGENEKTILEREIEVVVAEKEEAIFTLFGDANE